MILFCEAFISPGAITEPREQYFPKETLLNNIFEKGISTMGQQSLQETITQRAPAGDMVPKPARGVWGAGFARFSLTDSSSPSFRMEQRKVFSATGLQASQLGFVAV